MHKNSLNIAIIGSRIRLARENIGRTQKELTEKIDFFTQFISTIEQMAPDSEKIATKISSETVSSFV